MEELPLLLLRGWGRHLRAGWNRFWFEPEETSTLALVRIAFGALVLAWAVSLAHDAYPFFTDSGLLATPEFEDEAVATWGPLDWVDTRTAVAIGVAVLALASLALAAGLFTRIAAVVVFLGLLSFERRNPFVFNSGDGLLKVIAFYMMLAPAGASLSLDRLRQGPRAFWEFPRRAPWALRLMQVQLSIVYLSSVWTKLAGTTWNDGTAVSFAVRLEDLQRFAAPSWIASDALTANVVTYAALGIEAAVGVLVWNRKLRPWVLGLGVALHLGIELTIRVGFFSYGLLVLYLAFVSPDVASRWIRATRDRVAAWTRRPRAPAVARSSSRT